MDTKIMPPLFDSPVSDAPALVVSDAAGVYDIPIISRGRVIMPSTNAVEFGGRSGSARFRAPNPHLHIKELVLARAEGLSDLQQMPIREIIAFLAELGPRLKLDDNAYLQDAFELGVAAGDLPASIMRSVYDDLPNWFEPGYLTELVEATVGSAYLDSWVPQGEGERARFCIRAFGSRQLHITAGNVPVTAAITVQRAMLTKSDCLIKLPSNDPMTATAIARTLIDMDPDHPVTKHIAVAYWKGGDETMDSQICRLSRIDKITAWGGQASMKHIQKFLSPGIDLVAMNPKLSISIVGKEGLESDKAMGEVAAGLAVAAGRLNQTACANSRVVYVECDTDDESLDRLIALGEKIYQAFQDMDPALSTPAKKPNPELEAELLAIGLEEEMYWVKGDTVKGGVIVSRFSDRVDFHESLNNRIVNLVPLTNLDEILAHCDDSTQTVGVYPERVRLAMRDGLARAGVQRLVPLSATPPSIDRGCNVPSMPHDGMEPMRRMVRWVIEETPETN